MRRRVIPVVLGSVAAMALGAGVAPAATVKCSLPPLDGAGFYELKVTRTTCATGKAVMRRIERSDVDRQEGSTTKYRVRLRGRVWRCTDRVTSYSSARHTCVAGRSRIALRSGS